MPHVEDTIELRVDVQTDEKNVEANFEPMQAGHVVHDGDGGEQYLER